MNVSEILKWLEEESERLIEECNSNSDPYKTVNNSFLEGFNYALANIQGLEQPQLTDNQQAVLDGLKFIFVNYNQEFDTDGGIKYALRDFYWYLGIDYRLLEHKKLVSMCESYYTLSADKFAQVLEVFSRWTQEQGEE